MSKSRFSVRASARSSNPVAIASAAAPVWSAVSSEAALRCQRCFSELFQRLVTEATVRREVRPTARSAVFMETRTPCQTLSRSVSTAGRRSDVGRRKTPPTERSAVSSEPRFPCQPTVRAKSQRPEEPTKRRKRFSAGALETPSMSTHPFGGGSAYWGDLLEKASGKFRRIPSPANPTASARRRGRGVYAPSPGAATPHRIIFVIKAQPNRHLACGTRRFRPFRYTASWHAPRLRPGRSCV